MGKLKIGLLPFYIKLYDDYWLELRDKVNAFQQTIVDAFQERDLEVVSAEVCRIKPEFERAVQLFERKQVDAIVTLHLAYSPSLESISVLTKTNLPIIVLDTTPTYDFSPAQDADEILYNHGIHGVQDLCNLLIRNDKQFLLEVGHWEQSDVLDRVVDDVKATKLVKNIKTAKVGKIGQSFDGMGDFLLPEDTLKSTIGIESISIDPKKDFSLVTDEQMNQELEKDSVDFTWDNVDIDVYRKSIHTDLSVRNYIEDQKLTAFTVNFLDVTKKSGLSSMPFLEASKAMARGVGYAGEGDVLTAALVGALLSVYPDTSFTEMFCPDWNNESIFLSHMGEMNLRVTAEKPVLEEKEFPFTDADNPVVGYGRFRVGEVVYVCLAPGKGETYTLLLSQGEMLPVDGVDNMKSSIHGWYKPTLPIADFLTSFSKYGGIHHGVLVYGNALKVLKNFGKLMGWNVVVIGSE